MEATIKVGIKTKGDPVLIKQEDHTLLKNMLIGDNFHWERVIEAKLLGILTPYRSYNFPDHSGFCESEADKRITLINTLPLETYLECVVGSEMNPTAPAEFLKAHAVISRSWALGKILGYHNSDDSGRKLTSDTIIDWEDTSGHREFHVCSDDHCQRYQGFQTINPNNLKAIRETAGEILKTPDGRIVDTRFSKCCGGRTEVFSTCWQSREESCLESFPDPWCDLSSLSPAVRRSLVSTILKDYDRTTEGFGYRWESEVSKSEIKKNLWDYFRRDIGEIVKLEALHRGPSGRIDLIRIHGSKGNIDLGKELKIRRLLSSSHLYSSAFEIEDKGEIIRLQGKGWGHGVGLCQIGAANMALQGLGYKEILSFYYPGSRIFLILP